MRIGSSSVVAGRGVGAALALATLLGGACGQKGPLIAARPGVVASAAAPASAAAGSKVVPPSAPP